MKKIPLIISPALALIGCTKQGAAPEAQVSPGIQDDNPGISRDIVSLTADDAVTVAQMFCSKEGKTKGGESKTVKDVVTLSGKDGSANMYAVNFSNDEGFILVSATKKFFPILAEVEKGKFDDTIYQTGASVLLDEYNQSIDYCKAAPQEEVDKSFAAMWRAYEKKVDVSAFLKTKSYEDDLMNLVPAAMHEWSEAGYEVYPLCNAQGCGIPQSVYDQWYDIASSEANQHYSFEENSFVIKMTEYIQSRRGPLLSTTWNQGEPYNLSVPLCQGSRHPLGCVAIAVGQIMKYHQWPSSYSWSSMPNQLSNSVTTTTTLSDFLYSVGLACNIDYYANSSGATINDANHAFKSHFNYKNTTSIINHDAFQVYLEVMDGYPVYMRGEEFDELGHTVGHAWVCDGANNITIRETYYLKIISVTDYPLHFETAGLPYETSYGTMSLHMNWGWIYPSDGWYADGTGYYSGRCPLTRKDIIHIRPNN